MKRVVWCGQALEVSEAPEVVVLSPYLALLEYDARTRSLAQLPPTPQH